MSKEFNHLHIKVNSDGKWCIYNAKSGKEWNSYDTYEHAEEAWVNIQKLQKQEQKFREGDASTEKSV